jgi:hypothetical protein
MINKLINNILNQASFTLSDTKDRILVAAKKRAQEEGISNIPSPQDFKQQLEGLAIDSPNALQKAERLYNRSRNLMEKAIGKLESIKEELEAIQARLDSIKDKFSQITEITNIFSDILGVIKTLIPTLDLVLASQVTPVVSGTIIAKITEFKKDFKDKIKNTEGVISSLSTPQKFFMDEIDILEKPLTEGINNIQFAIDQIQNLLDQLNTIWANFNLLLPIPEYQDSTPTGGGDITGETSSNSVLTGTTLEEYLNNPDNLRDVITKVVLPTYKVMYEVRSDGPGSELYEAGMEEIPINQRN